MDQQLVEWAMKMLLSWKLRNGSNKYLLRKLAYRYVPKPILDRPKQGFVVPIDRWLRGPLKNWSEEQLNDQALFRMIPLEQPAFLSLLRRHSNKDRNTRLQLWLVLSLSEFVRGLGGSQ